ncbi:MAG: carboxymuconolactone decarboxylase family protein [Syntrophomonadaceae bacterium]|nr:carboxymuconolactone decarboxylase family protein [Thermoanaerobacterales bacterium]NLN22310.1 carboxymuconolactone decarboxylase family protein [Syntrophomonadaceae bacterium]
MSDAQEKISMLQQGQKVLKEKLPGVMNNFMGVSQSVMQDGKLSKREKQLIAIAVTVAIHCET